MKRTFSSMEQDPRENKSFLIIKSHIKNQMSVFKNAYAEIERLKMEGIPSTYDSHDVFVPWMTTLMFEMEITINSLNCTSSLFNVVYGMFVHDQLPLESDFCMILKEKRKRMLRKGFDVFKSFYNSNTIWSNTVFRFRPTPNQNPIDYARWILDCVRHLELDSNQTVQKHHAMILYIRNLFDYHHRQYIQTEDHLKYLNRQLCANEFIQFKIFMKINERILGDVVWNKLIAPFFIEISHCIKENLTNPLSTMTYWARIQQFFVDLIAYLKSVCKDHEFSRFVGNMEFVIIGASMSKFQHIDGHYEKMSEMISNYDASFKEYF